MFHLQGESQRRSCEVSESHKQPIDGGQTGDSFWLLELFLLIQEEIEEKIDAGEGVFSASIMQVSGNKISTNSKHSNRKLLKRKNSWPGLKIGKWTICTNAESCYLSHNFQTQRYQEVGGGHHRNPLYVHGPCHTCRATGGDGHKD